MGWSSQSSPLRRGLSKTSLEDEAQLSSRRPSLRSRKNRAGERECLFEPKLDRGGQKLGNPLGR